MRSAGAILLLMLTLFVGFVAIRSLPGAAPVVLLMLVIAVFAILRGAVVSRLVHVVEPGELLVLSGRAHTAADGRRRGYRVVRTGRVVRVPLLERADLLSTRPFDVTVPLRDVYARGGQVRFRIVARVSVIATAPEVHGAIERFLGKAPHEMARVAGETLAGAARTVMAERSLDELRADRSGLLSALEAEAGHDLAKLGLELDSLELEDLETVTSS